MKRVWRRYEQWSRLVADFISGYTAEHGFPPVNHEIADEFGMSKAWVSMMLDRMEGDGVITRRRARGVTEARTIRLTRGARQ
jgi:DNA-binding MarR family transcriptional regulator